MADIGKPKRKIRIEPEQGREKPPVKIPEPKREQPAKEPARTGSGS
jgi:hypothetical protein